MNAGKAIIKNSTMGLITQVLQIVLQFVTRAVFVRFIGIEVLGISSTCASILNTLSLTELGFQTAIVYDLYKPLRYCNEEQINDIINIFKLVYKCVGLFIGAASVICAPFIGSIMKGIEVTPFVYAIFFMHVADTVCSYFLAYKRALLYADQKEYISRSIDAVLNIIMSILKLAVLVITRNYLLYLIFQIAQTLISNGLVHAVCHKYYPYLHKSKVNMEELRHIWGNVKNIFLGKLAGYVYGSTDNLVISVMVGTVSVGVMSNYTTIIQSIKGLCTSVLMPLAPIIGNMLASTDDGEDKERSFLMFSHARYIIASIVIVPIVLLIDEVVTAWVGPGYILERAVVLLLVADFYIDIVHSSCCDYITGAGLFKEERNVELAGAVINLVSSIALTYTLGITGVLFGTFISQIFFWVSRSIIVYRYCFKLNISKLVRYWIKNIYMIIMVALEIVAAKSIYSHITLNLFITRFIVGGILCEIIVLAAYILFMSILWEQKKVIKTVLSIISGMLGKIIKKINPDPKRDEIRVGKGENPVYIIRRYQEPRDMSGFFSNYFYVMGHIINAKERGLKCVIDMKNYRTCYSEDTMIDGTANAWEYYFEQPCGITLEDAYASGNYILSSDMYQFGKVPNYAVDGGVFPDKVMVENLMPVIQENMKIKQNIVDDADKVSSDWTGSSVLGVHVRGTDMKHFPGHPVPPSVEEYMEEVDRCLAATHYDKIFLCTDEEPAIKAFENKYGDMVVKSDAFRSTDGSALHTTRGNAGRENHRYRLGLEVLTDAILLSRCTALVCGHSNVPYAAIVMNKNQYNALVVLDNKRVEE